MICLTFSQFFRGDFEDCGYQLYLVRDTEQIMYIGISGVSVWDRWFSGSASHMVVITDEKLRGNSEIGEVIERRLPSSWNWIIELWTKDDCCSALADELGARRTDDVPVIDLEALLIQKLAPLYNVMHAGGSYEDPMISKALDQAYKRILEK